MNELKQLQFSFNNVLEELRLPENPKQLYEPISYTITNGGKRMRPLLVLLGCKIFSEEIDQALNPAIGVELFHNFTLVHDDIMDHAPIRRGKPTVHNKWNDSVAILSGDAMMIKSYQSLVQTDKNVLPIVLDVFNSTALEVCEGQQFDMEFEERNDVSISEYLEMIRLKTAVLLAASLKIGAVIGGANVKDAQLLYDFGLNAGIAFQLQDDILDVYGETAKVGKQKGGDIIANKQTYLLIKAKELASVEQSEKLNSWLNDSNSDSEKVSGVTALYQEMNVRELAEAEMWKYFNLGLESLAQVQGDENWKNVLEQFATNLMHRES